MNVLYLLGSIQSFFFSLIILSKKNKNLKDFVLISWFLIISAYLLPFYFVYINGQYTNILPVIIVQHFLLVIGPLIYLYIQLIISGRKRIETKFWFHLIPFAVCFFADILYYSNIGFDQLTIQHYQSLWYTRISFVLRILSMPAYTVLILYKIKRYGKYINRVWSSDIRYAKVLSYALTIICIAGILCFLINYFSLIQIPVHYNTLLLVIISAFTFYAAYFGIKHKEYIQPEISTSFLKYTEIQPALIIPEIENIALKKDSITKSIIQDKNRKINKEELKIYENRLLYFMEKEKPYLNPDLSLNFLAEKIKITPHQLTLVLNVCLEKNFYDFVNSYRIMEIKKKLSNPNNHRFNMLILAGECGFNSKASFNRIFKTHTGITPTDFRKTVLQPVS